MKTHSMRRTISVIALLATLLLSGDLMQEKSQTGLTADESLAQDQAATISGNPRNIVMMSNEYSITPIAIPGNSIISTMVRNREDTLMRFVPIVLESPLTSLRAWFLIPILFVATAVNSRNIESHYSDEATKRVL